MSANTGGLASEKTLRDEFAGQALQGFCANPELAGVGGIAECAYDHAEAMLAEKARREAVVQQSSTNPDAGKMVWKQSPNMNGAIICETQFSAMHADDENVKAYGGFLVAESVPEEVKALIIRAPQLEAANRELVEVLDNLLASQIDPMGIKAARACKNAHAILTKHKGAA